MDDFLKLINEIYDIDIGVFIGEKLLKTFGNYSRHTPMESAEFDSASVHIRNMDNLQIHIHPNGIAWFTAKSQQSYQFGPIIFNDINPIIPSTRKNVLGYKAISQIDFVRVIFLVYYEINKKQPETSFEEMMADVQSLFGSSIISNSTENIIKSPSLYNRELLQILNAIQKGNVKECEKLMPIHLSNIEKDGRSYTNDLIFILSVYSTAATLGCLSPEKSYAMYTYFLEIIPSIKDYDSSIKFSMRMALEYTEAVAKESIHDYSNYVKETCVYINDNLNTKITIDDLASRVHISPSYLRKLFSEEAGTTLQKYIEEKKINAACFLLSFSRHDISYISQYLCYSQSYLTKIFKRHMNTTPLKYRNKRSK